MARIAVLTPLPPAPTGIADYSADVLALLKDDHRIDVFHDQDRVERDRLPEGCGLHRVAGFSGEHSREPYDLVVYQLGNGPEHDFVYEPLARVPGLLVLHDLVLHHSRAAAFLSSPEMRAYRLAPHDASKRDAARPSLERYRDEVAYSYPAQAERLVAAQLATVGALLPYAYPLSRLPVEASRVTAVHNGFMAGAVRSEVPGAEVVVVPMPAAGVSVEREGVRALRSRWGFGDGDFVVASFGLLTPEKRIDTLARAVARSAGDVPQLRLLLVGPVPDPPALESLLRERSVRERTVVTGRVPFSELAVHMEAADLVVHLRYPTARETSASLLRVLAQGRPAVISDLENLSEIPDDAVVRADPADEEGEVTRAILRLAGRPALRARLGERAAAFARREHSAERCRRAYAATIERARRLGDPPPRPWPSHWRRA